MGSSISTPKNKTGTKVVTKKVDNAKKTGVLSLQEHKLSEIPNVVFTLTSLRTFDVSRNKLQSLGGNIQTLSNLKSLNCDENKLYATALQHVSKLTKLQTLSAGSNKLGSAVTLKPNTAPKVIALPTLPPSLKNLKLNYNFFTSFPPSLCASGPNCLLKLQKLDLSNNDIVVLPEEIKNLTSLVELNLDDNGIIEVPETVGNLSKLKVLSLRRNQITVSQGVIHFTDHNPQPIHRSIFEDTLVIDLNLDSNSMTSSQLNQFEGFDAYLERRKKVKSKNLYGGALTDLGLCGLE